MNDNLAQTIQLDGPYLDIMRYRLEGLCCSQIVVKLVLHDLGQDNPDLVRSMAALCFGSYTGGLCGLLTGAACALSLALSTNPNKELPDAMFPLLLGELTGWFNVQTEKSYGGSSCEEILAASPDKRACSLLLISTVEKLQSILTSEGITAQGRGNGQL
jgi:hypothetical protein